MPYGKSVLTVWELHSKSIPALWLAYYGSIDPSLLLMGCICYPKASNMISRFFENRFLTISASLSAMLKWHLV